MGGRRHKKRRKRKGPQNYRSLRLSMPTVEIVKGHDGFMRGEPEPALLLAAYAIPTEGDRQPELLGRALKRLEVDGPFPEKIALTDAALFSKPLGLGQIRSDSLLLLALALEQDDGRDIRTLYSVLAQPERLGLWTSGAEVPAPAPLEELAALLPSLQPTSVELLLEQEDARDLCRHDEWIGAAAVTSQLQQRRQQWQLTFRDARQRNDWTATVDYKL